MTVILNCAGYVWLLTPSGTVALQSWVGNVAGYQIEEMGNLQFDAVYVGKGYGTKQPVDNTVDLETATWSNSIGAGQLVSVWTDPDFWHCG